MFETKSMLQRETKEFPKNILQITSQTSHANLSVQRRSIGFFLAPENLINFTPIHYHFSLWVEKQA